MTFAPPDLLAPPARAGQRRAMRGLPGRRDAARRERDAAILALSDAGLSSREISQLRVGDVKSFPTGRVSVQLRVDSGLLRGARRPRFVLLDGSAANQVARHLEARRGADRALPLFAGRKAGSALTRVGVQLVLRARTEILDRRER